MQHKIVRLNALLAKEIATVINKNINDPRISNSIVSIHRVETTPNLSHSFVYISMISNFHKHDLILSTLNDAAGFIRSLLSKSKVLSSCPTLHFRHHEDTEETARLSTIFESIDNSQNNLGDKN
jgi:ribosome-binding factor A